VVTSPETETVTSDDAGAFAFSDISIGAYTVTGTGADGSMASLVAGVAGGATTNISLVLGSAQPDTLGSIQGTVVDGSGDPIEGAVVSVSGNDALTATTGADGTFALTDLPADFVFLNVQAPNADSLDGGTRHAIFIGTGTVVSDVEIVLSGRPTDAATWVGGASCTGCHAGMHSDIVQGLEGAVHARFVTEGTSHMIYPSLWPAPDEKFLPLNPAGELLMVQDPADGEGLVNLALCTRDEPEGTQYLFKFYPEQPGGASLTADALDCTDDPTAVWIPVSGTIGGEGNWGEGYADPEHVLPDTHPNFGEGKQRYLAKVQDVPYLVSWMTEHGIPVDKAKQDYVSYLPVYMYQDATVDDVELLEAGGGFGGVPKFWQKGPDHWCPPTNTLSRNCAGCHATGLEIAYETVVEGDHTYKAVVTEFDYIDLNISCERCHGPGSEHAQTGDIDKIIRPQHLTEKSANEVCGQCHSSHAGKSATPKGVFKYAFNEDNADSLGNGFFVPGVYGMEDYYFNYDQPTTTNTYTEGPFHTWPDQLHGRAHSQQLPEMLRSAHGNNPYQRLTCATCHDVHGLKGGPPSLANGGYDFESPVYANNTLCLACHATHGPFSEVTLDDAAALQLDGGGAITKDGQPFIMDDKDLALSKNRVAKAVALHMQAEAGMGGALYTPADAQMPSGSCISCHMAKIGKLFDLNDDAQYHLALDDNGMSAVAEGNIGSHVFDIVWPGQSAILQNPDLSAGHDYDIMPNSCGRCHSFARLSGDLD